MAKTLLTKLANSAAASGLISIMERLELGSGQTLHVLTYHRVADPALSPELYPRVTVHPSQFEQHMRFLSQRCRVVGVEDVLRAVRAARPSLRFRPTRVSSQSFSQSLLSEPPHASATSRKQEDDWLIPKTAGQAEVQAAGDRLNETGQRGEAQPTLGAQSSGLPQNAVLITFDDAYSDFAENALPVLRHYNLPATLFVPTAFPDKPRRAFWWDQLYTAIETAHNLTTIQTPLGGLSVETPTQRRNTFSLLRDYVKSLPHAAALNWVEGFCAELEAPRLQSSVLSWDALREVKAAGITLGAHTRNHPMLDRITPDEVRAEAVGSWQDLRHETGETLPIFAYPSGGYNRAVVEILAQEGFELAFTTRRGQNPMSNADPLQLKRINVGPQTSLNLLRAQLTGWARLLMR